MNFRRLRVGFTSSLNSAVILPPSALDRLSMFSLLKFHLHSRHSSSYLLGSAHEYSVSYAVRALESTEEGPEGSRGSH